MAIRSAGSISPFCRSEEDPFLLLESCGKAIEGILRGHAGRPLRRSWIEHPYGEEEITLLEEEVLPAIAQCLLRVDQIDQALQREQDRQILRQREGCSWPGAEPVARAARRSRLRPGLALF